MLVLLCSEEAKTFHHIKQDFSVCTISLSNLREHQIHACTKYNSGGFENSNGGRLRIRLFDYLGHEKNRLLLQSRKFVSAKKCGSAEKTHR